MRAAVDSGGAQARRYLLAGISLIAKRYEPNKNANLGNIVTTREHSCTFKRNTRSPGVYSDH